MTNEECVALALSIGVTTDELAAGVRSTNAFVVATRLAYQYGIRVFPTRLGAQKWPAIKKWPDRATSSLSTVLAWNRKRWIRGQNWSVCTGRDNYETGVEIADIDDPEGFALLEQQHGSLPQTWTCESGRKPGARHLWFRVPDGAPDLMNGTKLLGGSLDIRGWHGQAVTAGSLHWTGCSYRWRDGCAPGEVELAEMPAHWRDLFKKKTFDVSAPKSRRSGSSRGPREMREHNGDWLLGDGEGRGGFNGPINAHAVYYYGRAGADADDDEFIAYIRAEIEKAPKIRRSPEQIAYYKSDERLREVIASARAYVGNNYESE